MTIQQNAQTAMRTAYGHYPSGVAVLAAAVSGVDRVLVASSFTVGVSLDPPLVMFAVQHTSSTWPHLRSAERIGVSVLASQQGDLCTQLAIKDATKRWAGVKLRRESTGALFIANTAVRFDCSIFSTHSAGDHDVVILEVHAHELDTRAEPLLFHRSAFRSLS